MKYEGIDDCLMHKGAAAKGQQLGDSLPAAERNVQNAGFMKMPVQAATRAAEGFFMRRRERPAPSMTAR